jgi:hypothetical protein
MTNAPLESVTLSLMQHSNDLTASRDAIRSYLTKKLDHIDIAKVLRLIQKMTASLLI